MRTLSNALKIVWQIPFFTEILNHEYNNSTKYYNTSTKYSRMRTLSNALKIVWQIPYFTEILNHAY